MPRLRLRPGFHEVCTIGQTTENQIQEIKAAGFKVYPLRVVSENALRTCYRGVLRRQLLGVQPT
jgi:hypothetical protein